METIEQNIPLFIIGDLNMDLRSKKGKILYNFMLQNNLKNFAKHPTRIETRFYEKRNCFFDF